MATHDGSGPAPLRFEPRLVEEAVRLILEQGASGVASAALARLRLTHRRELDKIYREPPGEAREAAFRAHYRSSFALLGLDRRVEECLAASPTLRRRVREVLVRSALPPEREGVELWEHRDDRGRGIPGYLVVALSPARLAGAAGLAAFLQPRLRGAADLLAPPAAGAGLPVEHGVGAATIAGPASGDADATQRCPLCAFPTMVWASSESLAGIRATIRRDFPDWRPSDRCCEHCADRYAGVAALAG